MSGPTVLYTLGDMATVLGVTPQALSNRRARGAPRVNVQLPEPAYVTRTGRPLFTRAQVEAILAERVTSAATALGLDTGPDNVHS